ncbi:MAG: class II aldolase/adducin family protein, partial [Thermoflexales bacterium]|nr:class II aldolase/adducin family protein [Thermoflexales bacterium]
MLNRWRDEDITSCDATDLLIYQARLVGEESDLVLWGGGNNSLKTVETDFTGRAVQAMRIKGSGSDMRTMRRRDYPAVRLDVLLPLFEREAMSDEEMVRWVTYALLEPDAPRPSIETLLHAFIPAPAVLHTHADAILALTNTLGREATVRACFGEDVLIVPYHRPGFRLSKIVGAAVRANPSARGLVLMNHGLVTWGETVREAYERHIALVSQAEAFIAQRGAPEAACQPMALDVTRRRALAARIAPLLRGALCRGQRIVLRFDDGEDVLYFMARPDAPALVEIGAATPDHMLNTKRAALWLPLPLDEPFDEAALRARIQAALDAYTAACRRRFEAHYDPTLLRP